MVIYNGIPELYSREDMQYGNAMIRGNVNEPGYTTHNVQVRYPYQYATGGNLGMMGTGYIFDNGQEINEDIYNRRGYNQGRPLQQEFTRNNRPTHVGNVSRYNSGYNDIYKGRTIGGNNWYSNGINTGDIAVERQGVIKQGPGVYTDRQNVYRYSNGEWNNIGSFPYEGTPSGEDVRNYINNRNQNAKQIAKQAKNTAKVVSKAVANAVAPKLNGVVKAVKKVADKVNKSVKVNKGK